VVVVGIKGPPVLGPNGEQVSAGLAGPTFKVTPEEGQILREAQAIGALHLQLRDDHDSGTTESLVPATKDTVTKGKWPTENQKRKPGPTRQPLDPPGAPETPL
jgi:hypothetical protein